VWGNTKGNRMPSKKKRDCRLWFTSQCKSESTKGAQEHPHTQILILSLCSCILIYTHTKNTKKMYTHRRTNKDDLNNASFTGMSSAMCCFLFVCFCYLENSSPRAFLIRNLWNLEIGQYCYHNIMGNSYFGSAKEFFSRHYTLKTNSIKYWFKIYIWYILLSINLT